MPKQRIEYFSPVDALVAVAKRLNSYEERYRLASEEFFDQFRKGRLDDSLDFVEWSNDYQHYIALKFDIEKRLRYAT